MAIVGGEDEAEEFLFGVGEGFDHVASVVGVKEELDGMGGIVWLIWRKKESVSACMARV